MKNTTVNVEVNRSFIPTVKNALDFYASNSAIMQKELLARLLPLGVEQQESFPLEYRISSEGYCFSYGDCLTIKACIIADLAKELEVYSNCDVSFSKEAKELCITVFIRTSTIRA